MTDSELRDAAVAALRRTTVSYPEWRKRVQAGRYTPKDGSGTEWGKAFAALEQIGAPPPTDIENPRGPFQDQVGKLFLRNPGDVTTEGWHILSSPDYGIGNMVWPQQASTGTWTLRDCIVENVSANPPRSMDGTGEAGFWVGQRTNASRLIARRCAWMGLWTGAACDGSTFEDIQLVEMPLVGAYLEHDTVRSTFRRMRIEAQGTGINVEWWYGGRGSHSCVIEDSEIYCPAGSHWTSSGIFLDAGTYGFTIRRCRFYGPGNAVWLPNRRVQDVPNVVEDCVFENAGARVSYHDNAIG